jgi:hypothetical protein
MSFAVVSLPRSRTAWLSTFFNLASLECRHELIATCDSFEEAIEVMKSGIGSVDTGQIYRLDEISQHINNIIVIDRSKNAVKRSLMKCGIKDCWFIDEQAELIYEASKIYPTFQYLDIDEKIEEIWDIVSGGRIFPRVCYNMIKDYKVEIINIKRQAEKLGIEKILKNYGISR